MIQTFSKVLRSAAVTWLEKGWQVLRLWPGSGWEVAWLRDSIQQLPINAKQATSRSRELQSVFGIVNSKCIGLYRNLMGLSIVFW